ncbi:MAG TPA: hypothetical protein VGL99_06215 [Chloroflexota bacterium]
MQIVVSVEQRDGLAVPDTRPLERFADALCAAGLSVAAPRQVTAADVRDLGSTWAKRLGIPDRRAAWLLQGSQK